MSRGGLVASVVRLDDGFVHPSDEIAAAHAPELGSHLVAPGMPSTVQFARFRVTIGDDAVECVLLSLLSHALDDSAQRAISDAMAAREPTAIVARVRTSAKGRTSVSCAANAPAPAVAAVAAIWRYWGSWDESDPIVASVNGRELAVSVRYDGGVYRAELRDPARP